ALGVAPAPEGAGEATLLLKQALAIRERNIKADAPAYLDLVDRLADISTYAADDQAMDIDSLMVRAIGLARDELGPKHPVVAALLTKLAESTRYRTPGKDPAAYAREAEQGEGAAGIAARMSKQWDEANKYEGPSIAILDEAIKSGAVDSSTKLT